MISTGAIKAARRLNSHYVTATPASRATCPAKLCGAGGAVRRERDLLIDRARQVSEQLKVRFGAQRVILFGSAVDPTWCDSDSDVDLSVEGLAPEVYWQAWGLAE